MAIVVAMAPMHPAAAGDQGQSAAPMRPPGHRPVSIHFARASWNGCAPMRRSAARRRRSISRRIVGSFEIREPLFQLVETHERERFAVSVEHA